LPFRLGRSRTRISSDTAEGEVRGETPPGDWEAGIMQRIRRGKYWKA
jgi:hypothetical protein